MEAHDSGKRRREFTVQGFGVELHVGVCRVSGVGCRVQGAVCWELGANPGLLDWNLPVRLNRRAAGR